MCAARLMGMLISRMLKLSAVSIFYTFKNRYRCPESYEAFQNVQTNVIDLLAHEFGDSKNARRSKEEIETIQQALGGGEARKRKDDNTHTSAAARCTKSHSGEYMLTHSVNLPRGNASTSRPCAFGQTHRRIRADGLARRCRV